MTTMASPKPQSSSSAESPEKLSEVQVLELDSVEPLVTASFSVPIGSAQVMDSLAQPPLKGAWGAQPPAKTKTNTIQKVQK